MTKSEALKADAFHMLSIVFILLFRGIGEYLKNLQKIRDHYNRKKQRDKSGDSGLAVKDLDPAKKSSWYFIPGITSEIATNYSSFQYQRFEIVSSTITYIFLFTMIFLIVGNLVNSLFDCPDLIREPTILLMISLLGFIVDMIGIMLNYLCGGNDFASNAGYGDSLEGSDTSPSGMTSDTPRNSDENENANVQKRLLSRQESQRLSLPTASTSARATTGSTFLPLGASASSVPPYANTVHSSVSGYTSATTKRYRTTQEMSTTTQGSEYRVEDSSRRLLSQESTGVPSGRPLHSDLNENDYNDRSHYDNYQEGDNTTTTSYKKRNRNKESDITGTSTSKTPKKKSKTFKSQVTKHLMFDLIIKSGLILSSLLQLQYKEHIPPFKEHIADPSGFFSSLSSFLRGPQDAASRFARDGDFNFTNAASGCKAGCTLEEFTKETKATSIETKTKQSSMLTTLGIDMGPMTKERRKTPSRSYKNGQNGGRTAILDGIPGKPQKMWQNPNIYNNNRNPYHLPIDTSESNDDDTCSGPKLHEDYEWLRYSDPCLAVLIVLGLVIYVIDKLSESWNILLEAAPVEGKNSLLNVKRGIIEFSKIYTDELPIKTRNIYKIYDIHIWQSNASSMNISLTLHLENKNAPGYSEKSLLEWHKYGDALRNYLMKDSHNGVHAHKFSTCYICYSKLGFKDKNTSIDYIETGLHEVCGGQDSANQKRSITVNIGDQLTHMDSWHIAGQGYASSRIKPSGVCNFNSIGYGSNVGTAVSNNGPLGHMRASHGTAETSLDCSAR